jgi:ABC-type molybdate transport system substrate-binding protein
MKSRAADGGRVWYAFAWTPLVQVYSPRLQSAPDLASTDLRFGLAHPRLSNNGVYNAVFFESTDPDAGAAAIGRTNVQPVNARASIGGIADGSFDVTLGYESVTIFFREQGARVRYDVPLVNGERFLVPVLFSVGLVAADPHPDTLDLARFLLSNATQERLARYGLRPVVPGFPAPEGGVRVDAPGVHAIEFDWARWREIEDSLPRYEVSG